MPKLLANGNQLYYELHGQGKPLVLIAGFSCDSSLWSSLIDEFAKSFQVLIFDNRGIGQSDSPDSPCLIEDMAKDTFALIDLLGLKKPHILGHSMGGAIAQEMARQDSSSIDKIVLVNSLIKLNRVSSHVQRFFLGLRLDGVSMRRIAEGVIPWIYSNDYLKNEENVESLIDLMQSDPYPQSIVGQRRQLEALERFDSGRWFMHIPVPTLVMGGAEDILCPNDSETLGKGIPQAKYISFPRIGHAIPIEKPEEFTENVVNFLMS